MHFVAFVLMLLTAAVLAAEPCPELPADPHCKTTWFIRNADPAETQPRNFRRSDGKYIRECVDDGPQCPSTQGLEDLHESGSAQPTVADCQWIKSRLPAGMPLVVFDLRQESHGFVGDVPVSWYLGRDQINCDKSDSEIERDEASLLELLRPRQIVSPVTLEKPGGDLCAHEKPGSAIDIPVSMVRSEKEVIESLGGRYVRIPVADFHAAEHRHVDQFVTAVLALPPNAWVHFHCAAGDGRTTTFMAMYDMMHNALTVDVETIIQRQYDLGGINLDSEGSVAWKQQWARERRTLAHVFYLYCRDQIPNGFKETFSQWRERTATRK
jgi:hypothetical protein